MKKNERVLFEAADGAVALPVQVQAENQRRLRQLGQAVEVMKRVSNRLDAEQVFDVVRTYSEALDLLYGYDHQTVGKPKTKGRSVEITYEE